MRREGVLFERYLIHGAPKCYIAKENKQIFQEVLVSLNESKRPAP